MELTCNHRTWCMLLRSKYCMRTQCCCIWLTCKTFQRLVSFKICKGLFYWNDYYNCVRRFVVSDPELPDSLYIYSVLSLLPGWSETLLVTLTREDENGTSTPVPSETCTYFCNTMFVFKLRKKIMFISVPNIHYNTMYKVYNVPYIVL